MVRRVGVAALLLVLAGCGDTEPVPDAAPVETYPRSFSVTDPAYDADSTADSLAQPPNVDLVGVSARVGRDGLRVQLRYAQAWTTRARARWGARFELLGSDGTRSSAALSYDPGAPAPVREIHLVPARAGCTGTSRLQPEQPRLLLVLRPGCLPSPTTAEPRPWIRFDSLEAVTSWHEGGRILYGWDQLYARVVAPEPERLYLPD